MRSGRPKEEKSAMLCDCIQYNAVLILCPPPRCRCCLQGHSQRKYEGKGRRRAVREGGREGGGGRGVVQLTLGIPWEGARHLDGKGSSTGGHSRVGGGEGKR